MEEPSKRAETVYADELVSSAVKAARAFDRFDQAGVDRIVEAVYRAAFDARIRLAEAAIEETGIGVLKVEMSSDRHVDVYGHLARRRG